MTDTLQTYTVLSAAATTGAGKPIYVGDKRHAVFTFATDGGADAALTVKFQGSTQDDPPTFGSAQSVTNMWDYVQVKDLEDGSTIDGDTGIAVATADDYRQVEVNTNHLKWVTANVTARTEGEVTVTCSVSEDN